MSKKRDLTEGSIFFQLMKLALPIMATSFIQMAYNMTDMIWIGRVGSKAVASAGTAGFYMWFGFAFILISKIGAEVGVAQSLGRKDLNSAEKFAGNSLQLIVMLAIFYGTFLIFFARPLIGFFRLGDAQVISDAVAYLQIIAIGTVFAFINPVFSGIYNGSGDSKTPFWINSVGLILNIVLDPLFIFVFDWGIRGAAYATIISQLIATLIFIMCFKSKKAPFENFHFFVKPAMNYVKKIVKFGFPVSLQSALFTIFAMLLARIIAKWGPIPIAVQKVGAQIEAISWMTAGGFSTALSAFIGQNFGANKWERIQKGYFSALGLVTIIGFLATFLLIFFAEPIFKIFIPEEESVRYGIVYLQILGLSQLFMCIEITTAGAFNGMGKTFPPSLISIIFTGLRVPAAMILSSAALLGLNGVWWSISISSIIKGIILTTWFLIMLHRHPDITLPNLAVLKSLCWNFKYLRDKCSISAKK